MSLSSPMTERDGDILNGIGIPAGILYKSIADISYPDRPIMASYSCIKSAYWDGTFLSGRYLMKQ